MSWEDIGSITKFPPGATRVELGAESLALVRIGDDLYAIGDTCSHAQASLSEGELWDYALECPLHGAEFDVRTGKPGSLPATQPVPTYEVRVEGDRVMIRAAQE
ncbi:MAG: non-heme iron oxygenase ferredoxin subunit [Acidimicrobiia bacterium]|nr:non-heme iron oxygenase ferredoxin subunit [bacterium]MXX64957.1 non-heme iron oxygenase ferredoxin subunit [Acidimicrobiia bacterium]MCY3580905.1 non-heme iron oxygenase ferredoxin subunit [bacterium]MCY3652996.1 non-heme iron oxygenase ferredoxin subunit [bacterium]MDE0644371.1 non-heme iron oxygenase ferredoxin subunit [bacterium]